MKNLVIKNFPINGNYTMLYDHTTCLSALAQHSGLLVLLLIQ